VGERGQAGQAAAQTVAAPKPQPAPRLAKAVMPPQPPPLAPLGRRERSQLSRGKKSIEARIDLHGMTQTRAHQALFAFLERATHQGFTFVLVITGKGRVGGAASERGVLRRQVPQWLGLPEFRGMVVGFEEAPVGHGLEHDDFKLDHDLAPSLRALAKQSRKQQARTGLLRRIRLRPKAGFGGQESSSQ
jgi:DNA-nicking Smr family endonuclease